MRVSSGLVNCISTFVHWTRLALGTRGRSVIITGHSRGPAQTNMELSVTHHPVISCDHPILVITISALSTWLMKPHKMAHICLLSPQLEAWELTHDICWTGPCLIRFFQRKVATLCPLDYERASYDVVCFKRMELIEGSRHSLCSMHSSMKQREYSMEKTLNRRDSAVLSTYSNNRTGPNYFVEFPRW